MFEKTAILIHGRHLETPGWEDIMWGDPAHGRYGQIPTALKLILELRPKLIYWGTGVSQKDGVIESRYAYNYAIAHANELPEFAGFDSYEIEAMLRDCSFIDRETKSTTEEIRLAFNVCKDHGIRTLFLTSAPTHIARCMQEAQIARAELDPYMRVFALSSDVSYQGYEPKDVVVVEPPHRGDLSHYQTHRYVKAMFSILRQEPRKFEDFLFQWGRLLEAFGVTVDWEPVKK